MENKETAIVACEVRISVTANSYQEIQELIERLRAACTDNYKLEVNFSGEFFKRQEKERTEEITDEEIPNEETCQKWKRVLEATCPPPLLIELQKLAPYLKLDVSGKQGRAHLRL